MRSFPAALFLLAAIFDNALAVNFVTKGKHGAVVSEVAECSAAGAGILKEGGSAADAVIATGLCVGTIAAYHSGIGGGGFMIVRSSQKGQNNTYEMIDFRETMPALGNETMYVNNTDPTASTIGGLAVGTPGELRGWEALHKRHGKLPWKTLFQPAINLARNGFKVNVDLFAAINSPMYAFILKDPLFAEVYAPNGTLLGLNETAYRKRYADTLTTISEQGPDAFYTGAIANRTVAAAKSARGIISMSDLANYSVVLREPENITYRDKYRVWSTIAPSSGTVVLSALKIFEGYNGSAQPTDPAINQTTHKLIQATRFGYGQRTNYGDPAFTANVSAIEKLSLQEDTVTKIRAEIDNVTHPATYYDISSYTSLEEGGTSHMAVVDGDGNAVSLTTTVNLYWGARVMTEDGVILNDEMDDFSSPGQTNSFGFPASPTNFIRPFKRPQSSISSSIAEDLHTGELVIATGSAGGSRIITATLQHLYHHLDQGMDAFDATHQGRWHDQLTNVTYFETALPTLGLAGLSNATVAYLQGLGYNVTYQDGSGSTSHVIIKKDGKLDAASDPRKAAGGASVF